MRIGVCHIIAICAMSLLVSCSPIPKKDFVVLSPELYPALIDDGDKNSLLFSYQQQLIRLQSNPKDLTIADDYYDAEWLSDSLSYFIELVEKFSGEDLQERLQNEFVIYQAGGLKKVPPYEILMTGYFEPTFPASKIKEGKYQFPIYSKPTDLTSVKNEDGKFISKRKTANGIEDYWTRAEIEDQNLLGGQEIAYLADPIDVFVLHIQGSGKLQFPDGEVRSFQYAGNNGLGYKSIGRLLIDTDKLTKEETNMESIRAYLDSHPEELKQILQHNPRYIFFTDAGEKQIRGSADLPLTPMRSIAIDEESLPWQLPTFVTSTIPHFSISDALPTTSKINRFLIAQDTGSAIKGHGRVDLFCGNGTIARRTASHMKERGSLYFLVRKKTTP